MKPDFTQPNGATFSPCHTWRYLLWRTLGAELFQQTKGTCVFVMLNPSTAGATLNDPTITRCSGFAWQWGYHRLAVVNLFAFRATDPRELLQAADPFGPDNARAIFGTAAIADPVVCAWGTHGDLRGRGVEVAGLLRRAGVRLHHLGLSQGGQPKHPLYLKGDLEPQLWK